MITCKFCKQSDLTAIDTIVDDERIKFPVPMSKEDRATHKILIRERINSNDPLVKIVGLYNTGVLKGFCNIRLWESWPFWSCSNMFIINEDKSLGLSYHNNGFIEMQRFSQSYAESKGYFEQYHSIDMRIYRAYEKLFAKGLERYTYVIEAYYKQGETFRFKHHSGLFGWAETSPYDSIISKTCLKQEYRKEIVFKILINKVLGENHALLSI
jgi:hypothetical protein